MSQFFFLIALFFKRSIRKTDMLDMRLNAAKWLLIKILSQKVKLLSIGQLHLLALDVFRSSIT